MRGKNYAAEADYLGARIQRYLPGARPVLDLGCGIARHAICFVEKGWSVVGVDRTPEMMAKAHRHRERLLPLIRKRLTFEQGDIRDLRLGRQLDAVVALFHVISYQISNGDLIATLTTAKARLRANGPFVFGCRYGPGVLTDPPAMPTKNLSSGSSRLTRSAEPVMRVNDNAVKVKYRFELSDEKSRKPLELLENVPELFLALQKVRLYPLGVTETMSQVRARSRDLGRRSSHEVGFGQ